MKTGLLRNSNTQCLNGQPLKELLQDELKQDVHVENDANCFALAEPHMERARLQGCFRGNFRNWLRCRDCCGSQNLYWHQ